MLSCFTVPEKVQGHSQVLSLNPGRDLREWTPERRERTDFAASTAGQLLHQVQSRKAGVRTREVTNVEAGASTK